MSKKATKSISTPALTPYTFYLELLILLSTLDWWFSSLLRSCLPEIFASYHLGTVMAFFFLCWILFLNHVPSSVWVSFYILMETVFSKLLRKGKQQVKFLLRTCISKNIFTLKNKLKYLHFFLTLLEVLVLNPRLEVIFPKNLTALL